MIFVLGVLLVFGQVYGQGNQATAPMSPAIQKNQDSANTTEKPQESDKTTNGTITINNYGDSYKLNKEPQNVEGKSEKEGVDWASGTQAFCAIGLMVLAAFQFWIIVRQTKILDEQGKILANQLKTAQLDLRAYVSPSDVEIIEQDAQNADNPSLKAIAFIFKVSIKNTGNSPARKLTAVALCGKMPYPIPQGVAFAVTEPENRSVITIGSGEVKRVSATAIRYNNDEIREIMQAGGTRIYVWGMVKYEDVFGDPHWTKFCKFVQWTEGKAYAYNYKDYNEET